jgi:Ser/Thr protein kinase RdoA (MazF antagonist)
MKPPRVIYSTPSPAAVIEHVASRYGLPGPLGGCTLLKRGFNDCFELRDADGQRFVLRVSGFRLRGKADVAAETAFIAHLDRAGVPVAAPVPTRSGALFTRMSLPEASRPAVLFWFAEGRVPSNEVGDARLQGATLARIHEAAAVYAGRDKGLYHNDLDNLLHAPLNAVLSLSFVTSERRDNLLEVASRLGALVKASSPLAWTHCHGDCHGGNARIATQGPSAGKAIFFDFDDGGPGFLAYDLSVFLWAQMSFERRRPALWHAFVDGYRSVRPIADNDYEATHAFVAIRHIWLMGQWASRSYELGSEVLSVAWLDKELMYLESWVRERLSPNLLSAL